MVTIKQALAEAISVLTNSESPERDATLLLAHSLKVSTTALRTWPDKEINVEDYQLLQQYCQRRVAGEPVAYILGEWEFWSLPLIVTPDTLVPRPETEHLVEWVLSHFPPDSIIAIADLGTGTGAIALALASERPKWQIIATDRSLAALEVAKRNAANLKLPHIDWRQGHWLQPLEGEQLDIIISNPPYIAADDPHLQLDGLPFEPQTALVAAENGYKDLQELITTAPRYLKANGWLVLEHGFTQAVLVQQYMQQQKFQHITTHYDFSGQPRYTVGQKVS